MFEPGDFVRVKNRYWFHNRNLIGMVCHCNTDYISVVFDLIPDKKTGKGQVWVYREDELEKVDMREKNI